MNKNTLNDICNHAVEEYPRESCGVVVIDRGKEVYVRCHNSASSPSEHFALSALDYSEAQDRGDITHIVHSHPDVPARPSQADLTACEASGHEWIIVSVHRDENGKVVVRDTHSFSPSGYDPGLIGVEFSHGVNDCFSLIRRWYERERGITLPDFERHDNWWNDGHSNLYMDHFREAGFEPVGQYPELEVGDVILMQIRSKNGVPNHAGVYVGDGMILHHMYGRLSCKAIYGGMLRDYTRLVVRYKRNGE